MLKHLRKPRKSKELISGLFSDKTENSWIQFFRYFYVSAVGLVVDFLLLVLLTEVFGVFYILSAVVGFCAGLVVNYILAILWVFNERTLENRSVEFLAYTIIGVIGLGINTLGLWVLTDLVGLYFVISKVFVTGFVFIWNFIARKIILFR